LRSQISETVGSSDSRGLLCEKVNELTRQSRKKAIGFM